MDKLTKILIGLMALTVVLVVVGDISYAKYRTSGHRLPSVVSTSS